MNAGSRRRTAELSRANTLLTREIADRERAEGGTADLGAAVPPAFGGVPRSDSIVANKRGRIKSFNPAAQRAFGYAERKKVLGQPLSLLMPPEDREAP